MEQASLYWMQGFIEGLIYGMSGTCLIAVLFSCYYTWASRDERRLMRRWGRRRRRNRRRERMIREAKAIVGAG